MWRHRHGRVSVRTNPREAAVYSNTAAVASRSISVNKMREIEVRLKRQKLADALGDMRQWLDGHDCVPISFNIARGGRGTLLANVVFKEDHMAEAFLRDFG
jgi:hypothetical protein